jgi:predicted O-methyltransferase YrrM
LERWYPTKIIATESNAVQSLLRDPKATSERMQLLQRLFRNVDRSNLRIAEFGVWKGGATASFAKFLDNKGELHIFDFTDNLAEVKRMLNAEGFHNVTGWGNSYKYLDSYNWPLRLILEQQPNMHFDYVYIDGAHTWAVDALTFLLCDQMLNKGGYIEFDDYNWRLRGSSLDPAKVPSIEEQYTDEQIDDMQVKAIVDLLVRRKRNYREIRKNRIFQKTSAWKRYVTPSTIMRSFVRRIKHSLSSEML